MIVGLLDPVDLKICIYNLFPCRLAARRKWTDGRMRYHTSLSTATQQLIMAPWDHPDISVLLTTCSCPLTLNKLCFGVLEGLGWLLPNKKYYKMTKLVWHSMDYCSRRERKINWAADSLFLKLNVIHAIFFQRININLIFISNTIIVHLYLALVNDWIFKIAVLIGII